MTEVVTEVTGAITAGVAIVAGILSAGVGIKGAFFVWKLISRAWNRSA